VTLRWVASDADLADLIGEMSSATRIAVDTEFHRERTYYPRLALMQFAWESPAGQSVALVDPLACDVRALIDLFRSDRLFVFHAAQQDLDVLAHSLGTGPKTIFDTQLAAGFVGYSTPSLANLVNAELRRSLPKGDRLTDWLRRPLTDAQRTYAAADVEHLFELTDRLEKSLRSRNRLEWAHEACRELLQRKVGPSDPTLAWTRMKDLRAMRPRTRGVLAAVAEWRERRAMASDIPPRQVLPDLALQGIAQREPRTLQDLAQARGVDDRHSRGTIANEILAAVARGLETPLEMPPIEGDELDRRLRPAVTLVSAWLSEVARREEIDPMLIGTRADIVEFLRDEPEARLAHGWRLDLVGRDLRGLVAGRTGLAFDGQGGLVMFEAPSPNRP
jgi:ribonuclease D